MVDRFEPSRCLVLQFAMTAPTATGRQIGALALAPVAAPRKAGRRHKHRRGAALQIALRAHRANVGRGDMDREISVCRMPRAPPVSPSAGHRCRIPSSLCAMVLFRAMRRSPGSPTVRPSGFRRSRLRAQGDPMDLTAEWLEADAQGGFASGTVGGERTRRYHGLLLVATHPPGGRVILVNGIEAWVTTPSGNHPISSQRYTPDVVYPDGSLHLTRFSRDPWPNWRFVLPGGTEIVQEMFVSRETSETVLRWSRLPRAAPPEPGLQSRQRGEWRKRHLASLRVAAPDRRRQQRRLSRRA
jgi:hypothetical protein